MDTVNLGETESLCPVCLKSIGAARQLEGDEVFQIKECDEHGPFSHAIPPFPLCRWTNTREGRGERRLS